MEVCPETEVMAIRDQTAVCDKAFQISDGLEAQMICYMRHGARPQLMAPQPIRGPDPQESP